MPTSRSLIQIAVGGAVLLLIVSWVSLFQTPDSNKLGQDSYGTRESGYRAIYETLGELGVRVERRLRPPVGGAAESAIVFLNPDSRICGVEPVYLEELKPWVEAGGRVVVALGPPRIEDLLQQVQTESTTDMPTILESLGLAGVRMEYADWNEPMTRRRAPDKPLSEALMDEWNRELAAPLVVKAGCWGSLADWDDDIEQLALPSDQLQNLICEETQPTGEISYRTADGETRIVAARFSLGQGTIFVVDEGLFRNRFLPQEDNAVLAVYAISPLQNAVVFDEFYHGLGVRGNPLYLLTQPGYAALALGLLLCIGLGSWRKAVALGPSLPEMIESRRDIGEYVVAMGNFFARGRSSDRFLIHQLREGVIRELNVEFALPPETRNVELLAGLMARKDPRRSDELRQAIREADDYLESRTRLSKPQLLSLMQRLSACL